MRCSDANFVSDEHQQIKALATFFLIVWPLGIPFMFATLLFASRTAIR